MTKHCTSRRTWIQQSSAAAAFYAAASKMTWADQPTKKILFFNRSAGFEHSVVKRDGQAPSFAERMMMEFGKKHRFEVMSTKDGRVFEKDYREFDAFFFYTTEDLTNEGGDRQPPMSKQGKMNFLEAVSAGKGFAGAHCASDTFHTAGDRTKGQEMPDPYIAMIGGEFIRHGQQQMATMRVVDKQFQGLEGVREDFDLHEEWYSLKNFAPDMHVLLVQETEGMKDADYQRPAYPATWIRKHGQGRVFYTSMGHREDVWTNPIFEKVLMGGMNWILQRFDADTTANLSQVTPQAGVLPKL
jgi:type 1 glutamine amidotransferase